MQLNSDSEPPKSKRAWETARETAAFSLSRDETVMRLESVMVLHMVYMSEKRSRSPFLLLPDIWTQRTNSTQSRSCWDKKFGTKFKIKQGRKFQNKLTTLVASYVHVWHYSKFICLMKYFWLDLRSFNSVSYSFTIFCHTILPITTKTCREEDAKEVNPNIKEESHWMQRRRSQNAGNWALKAESFNK